MPKIPEYNPQGAVNIAQGPATVNAAAFGAPFKEAAASLGELSGVTNQGLEKVRGADMQLANAYTPTYSGTHPSFASQAASVIAKATGDFAKVATAQAIQYNREQAAIASAQHRSAATEQSIDWYTQNVQNFQGDNAAGFAQATKQALQKITDDNAQGLSGLALARYKLQRFSDMTTLYNSAATHELQQHTKNINDQTSTAIIDATNLAAKSTDPSDLDVIIKNLADTVTQLHPGEEVGKLQRTAAMQVVGGAIRVASAAGDFQQAQNIVNRFQDQGLVPPTAVVNSENARRYAETKAMEDQRRADAQAKADLVDHQNQVMFELYSQFREDPIGFRQKYTPDVIRHLAENRDISFGQGRSAQQAIAQSANMSDPMVSQEAKDLLAHENMTSEWINDHAGKLSFQDMINLQTAMRSQVSRSAEGKAGKLFVRAMFAGDMKTARGFNDQQSLDEITTKESMATDMIQKDLEKGLSLPVAKARAELKYSPNIGENVSVQKNDFINTFPAKPSDMQEAYQKLWDNADKYDRDTWNHQYRVLNDIKNIVDRRNFLRQVIQDSVTNPKTDETNKQ